jgi:hypothetical protein
VQAIGVVDVFDESADMGAGVFQVGVGSPVDFSAFSVFMKLSALALS